MDMLRVHVMAPMRLCHAALPRMIEHGAGGIINVSSISAFLFGPGNVNYSATKAYLTSFSLGLDTEVRSAGVRVQSLCPGFTHTEIHTDMPHVKRQYPAWMWGKAEDVVEASLRQLERNGAVICVPGLLNKVMWRALTMIPRGLRGKLGVKRKKAAK